jgi:hypothetical protein
MSSGDAADASAPAPRMQPVTITLPSVDVRMLTSQSMCAIERKATRAAALTAA